MGWELLELNNNNLMLVSIDFFMQNELEIPIPTNQHSYC